MGWSFATYLLLKGVKQLVDVSFPLALGLGFLVGVLVWWWTGAMRNGCATVARPRWTRP